jgi:hypothetical protein
MEQSTSIAEDTLVIPLSRGMTTVISREKEYLAEFKWYAHKGQQGDFYAARTSQQGTIRLHREIMGAQLGQEVDHINGNTLDNRTENLRLCGHTQNMMNRKPQINNTSGFKGVVWHKRAQRWYARIQCLDREHHLGSFDHPESAARAYDAAARELFGEFARLNFPIGTELGAR